MVFENLAIGSDIFNQGVTGITFLIKIIAFGGGLSALIFVLYKMFFEYYINVTIVKPIGASSFGWSNDKAKIVTSKEDGTRQLVLMKTRDGRKKLTTAAPSSKFKGRKGKNDHYLFLVDDNFQLQNIAVQQVIGQLGHTHLKLMPQDKRWWARKEDKRRLEKYAQSDALSKYLPSILVMVAFIVTFFIAYFGFSHLGEGMTRLAGEFGNVAAQCTMV
tara:strand:- start:606 stop:1256 length:651 start_codon:yes stop_codon:yes gene_type:complete